MLIDRPPSRILSTGLALAVLLFLLAIYLASQPPAMGLSLAPLGDEVAVSRLGQAAPAEVQVGDRVLAVRSGELFLALEAGDMLAEPDDVARYADYNRFFERQRTLWAIQQQAVVGFLLDSAGAEPEWVEVRPLGERPLSDLPLLFWYQVACGLAIFLPRSFSI